MTGRHAIGALLARGLGGLLLSLLAATAEPRRGDAHARGRSPPADPDRRPPGPRGRHQRLRPDRRQPDLTRPAHGLVPVVSTAMLPIPLAGTRSHGASARLPRARRPERLDARAHRAHPAGRALRRVRPDRRRDRHRQGAGGGGSAPAQLAAIRALRARQLRRAEPGTAPERALRPRAGRLHRRGRAALRAPARSHCPAREAGGGWCRSGSRIVWRIPFGDTAPPKLESTRMGDKSAIEWTDATWNPVTGCTKVSPGCKHCYAKRLAHRLRAMGNARYRNGFAVTLHADRSRCRSAGASRAASSSTACPTSSTRRSPSRSSRGCSM